MELLEILDELARKDKQNPPSFRDFLSRYVYIEDEGGTKFSPWPWQLELADIMQASRMLLILKARQLGISWMVASYAVYRAVFEKGCLGLMLSQTEPDAKDLLSKSQFVFDHLPDALKPKTGLPNTQILKFPDQYSSIVALPSTKRAGRGKTAKLAVCDEYAQHEFAAPNFAALKPTVEAGGQWFLLSTADGLGNTFADLWAKATSKRKPIQPELAENGQFTFENTIKQVDLTRKEWLPIFLGYFLRPGRDEEWWFTEKDGFVFDWMVHQEYPSDPEEAFIQTGHVVFNPDNIRLHAKECEDPLPIEEWPAALRSVQFGDEECPDCPINLFGADTEIPALRIWKPPVGDNFYLGGVDISEGLAHGDYSHVTVINQKTNEEVLTLHGHWPPEVLAYLVDRIARVYPGMYGVERNNHGHTCLLRLKELGTPGIYRERPVLGKLGQVLVPGKIGWVTTQITKPLMIDELSEALRTFGVHLNDALNIPELLVYRTEDNGATSAPPGKYDDRVMALAICHQMRKYLAMEPDTCGIAARPWSSGETAGSRSEAPRPARRYSVF